MKNFGAVDTGKDPNCTRAGLFKNGQEFLFRPLWNSKILILHIQFCGNLQAFFSLNFLTELINIIYCFVKIKKMVVGNLYFQKKIELNKFEELLVSWIVYKYDF
jgi:hypothetical protein